MRGAFVKTLTELAQNDPRLLLLTGDLGYLALEPFANKFPDRFLNVGVAEQNMVGIATGLSESGFIPFVYSIVTFATLRPYEFIRNGPIAHKLPVRIVGVGGGVEYSHNGLSHYGLEDLAVMRVQPGMTIIAPADHEQTSHALKRTWDLPGPVYYRIGKDDRKTVPGLHGRFELGRAQVIHEGKDLLLIALGAVSYEAALACEILDKEGISASLLIVSSLNPSPVDDLAYQLSRFVRAITVEAHYLSGGLGSCVCELVAERKLNCRILRCGVSELPDGITGSQSFLYNKFGLSPEAIVEKAKALCAEV